MMPHMASLIRKVALAAVTLLEDAIERLGDPRGGEVMFEALRKARDRGAELAIENARLEDECEALRADLRNQDKPLLYHDEVEALGHACEHLSEHRAIIRGLLDRSEQCPLTAEGMRRLAQFQWSDGSAVFDPEDVPADDPQCSTSYPCDECRSPGSK